MEVRSVRIRGVHFRFRAPSRRELRTFLSSAGGDQYELQQAVIEACILDPEVTFDEQAPVKYGLINFSRPPYLLGDIRKLSDAILGYADMTNPQSAQEMVDRAAQYVQSDEGRLDMLACMTMPGLSPTELDDLAPDELVKIWSMGKYLAPVLGIDSRMVLKPEEWEAEQQRLLTDRKRQEMMEAAQARINGTRNPNSRVQREVEATQTFNTGK